MNDDAAIFLCLGYTCLCGERVTVFRLPVESSMRGAIGTKAVSCRKGHSRIVTLDQLGTLDHWTEQVEDEALETGT